MNTVNAIKMLLIAGLAAAASPSAHAVVVDTGASSARDIFVNATVSASAAGLNLAAVNLGIPELNRASGSTAVDGPTYAKTASVTPSAT